MTRANSTQRLLGALRVTQGTVSEWTGMSHGLVRQWQQGTYEPRRDARARLVKAARRHAKELLALASRVEAEGQRQKMEG